MILREVNDRIAALDWTTEDDADFEFLCECSDPNCIQTVMLRKSDYMTLRKHGWVLSPGHVATTAFSHRPHSFSPNPPS